MEKKNKGVAGLTILLSLVTMLFVIGLVVMIFAIMGSEMANSQFTETTVSVANETLTTVTETGENLIVSGYRDVVCTISRYTNVSGSVIGSNNYTATNCNVKTSATTTWGNNSNINVTYSYTWSADNTATGVINDTAGSISSVVDFYDIFIIIGTMIVLILLVVVVISAIQFSGSGANEGAPQGVGTA